MVVSPKLVGNDLHFVRKLLDIVCSPRLTRRSDQPSVFLSTDMIVFEGLRPQFLIRSGDSHLSRQRLQKDGPIPSGIVWEGCFYSVGPAGNIDVSGRSLFSNVTYARPNVRASSWRQAQPLVYDRLCRFVLAVGVAVSGSSGQWCLG
jgi:hypothetical protein